MRAAIEAAKRKGDPLALAQDAAGDRPALALGIGLGVEDEADGIAARVTDTMQKLENAAQKGLLGQGESGAARRLAAGVQLNHAQIAHAMPQAGLFAVAGPTEAAAAGTAKLHAEFQFLSAGGNPGRNRPGHSAADDLWIGR